MKIARHARRRAGLRAQPERQLVLRLDGGAVQHARDRRRRQRRERSTRPPSRRSASRPSARSTASTHRPASTRPPGCCAPSTCVASDYQKGGQDFIAGWNAHTGQFSPGYPSVDNDLGFLTGETRRRRHRRSAQTGGRRRHRVQRRAGVQLGRPAGQQRLAEAVRRLDRRDARCSDRSARSTPAREREEGRRHDHARRHAVGVHDAGRRPARRARGRTSTTTSPTPATTRATRSRRDARSSASVSEGALSWSAPGGNLMCGKATQL